MSLNLTSTEVMLKGLKKENLEYLKTNFVVRKMKKRGRSVFATKAFKKGDYIMEYKGLCKNIQKTSFFLHRNYMIRMVNYHIVWNSTF